MVKNGELIVSDLSWRDPLCDAFIKGAIDYGIPYNNDYNGEKQEGVSYVQEQLTEDLDKSSSKSFLNPIKKEVILK